VTAAHFAFHLISGVAYLWVAVLFPTGRLPDRWRSRATVPIAGAATLGVVILCWRSSFIAHPPFFVAFFGVLVPVVGLSAQLARRGEGGPVEHQQRRLFTLALIPALAAALLWLAGHALEALTSASAARAFTGGVQAIFPAVFALVPVMLFFGILRYRLWDIDVLVSRSLWLAMLIGFVALSYLTIFAVTAWWARGRGWAAAVALVIVAVGIQPVRGWARGTANRVVFGQVLSPREAMRSLVDRLETSAPADELSALTAALVGGTRARRAELWLVLDHDLHRVAAAGDPGPESVGDVLPRPGPSADACCAAVPGDLRIPVLHEGVLHAVLSVSVPAGVALPAEQQQLIRDLARHAGLLVANARLTADLERQVEAVTLAAAQLQESRSAVVLAQDAERQRLERDIHDGAQQQIVGLLIQLRAGLRAASDGPLQPDRMATLRGSAKAARTTLLQLASGGIPPSLRDGDLAAALEAVAASARQTRLAVTVAATIAPGQEQEALSAVYFCCVEALQNVIKHAGARQVRIDVTQRPDGLEFMVRDDGCGFPHPSAEPPRAIAERIAALAGSVEVQGDTAGGSTVSGFVPALHQVAPEHPAVAPVLA
jgi:signal transduction histidine kinase